MILEKRSNKLLRLIASGLLTAVCLLTAAKLYAFVNEAISIALEAATPYVEQGFEVREDSWSGQVEPKKPLLVRHQLFRGNEYWFWAGTSWPGASVRVDIFDSSGNSVGLESFAEKSHAGVRVLPQKTATYYIRMVAQYDPEKAASEARAVGVIPAADGVVEFGATVDWGLVYGYR